MISPSYVDFGLPCEIPVEIGNLKLLEILDIRESSLTGPIPNVIFNMSSLMAIILIKNNLTGSIPKKVGNLTLLNDLYLFDNMFTGPKQQIPKALRLLSISPLSGEWLRDLVLQVSHSEIILQDIFPGMAL
ncbi:hypothetical protein LguiB_018065 [Lonicera macranthoides]